MGIGVLLVLWFSAPLWFPWVLRPLARHAGARYARYQRQGYDHFSLQAFTYTNRSVRLTAGRVEALTPTVWLWRLAVRSEPPGQPFLKLSDWDWKSLPSAKPARSVYSDARKWAGELQFLRRWVPVAALSNGTVRVQNMLVKLPALRWSNGTLRTELTIPKLAQQAVLTASVSNAPPFKLQIQSRSLHLDSIILLSTNAAGLSLHSTNLWWQNPVEIQAQFGRTGSLPEQASLQARHFSFPAALANLPQYSDITGSLMAKWQHGHFNVDLTAVAHPQAGRTNLPPLDVALHARGNTNRAIIETATVSSPWLRAKLSHEIVLHFTGPILREPAELSLTADLSRQHWLPLAGTLKGEAQFRPTTGKFPAARFQLSGSDIGTPQLQARTFEVAGALHWPWLSISNAQANFKDGSTASFTATLEVPDKLFKSGQFTFAGPLARHWLPSGYSYQNLAVSVEFSGPLTNLNHTGHLEVTNFTSPDLRPLEVALDWKGTQENLSHVAVGISADHASLRAQGALALQPAGGHLLLDVLTLRHSGKTLLSLSQPARFSFERPSRAAPSWVVTVESFQWAGPGGDLSLQAAVDWPHAGRLTASARGLHSALLQGFLKSPPQPISLDQLNLSGDWTNGPVHFKLECAVAGNEKLPLEAQLDLSGNAKGLSLHKLNLTSQSAPVITANGFVPLILNPATPSRLVQINSNGPVRLQAVARSQDVFWNKIAAWTGVQLRGPHLALDIGGTWAQPRGQVRLQAQQIQLAKSKWPMPRLEDLQLDLQVSPREARLVKTHLLVQGQLLTVTGEVPLGETFWTELRTKRLPNLDQARAHVQMDNARLAAFTELYPSLLSPQGEINLNLSLLPGFKLEGQLSVRNAATRPLPSLGPIRDITVNIALHGHQLLLQRTTANLGGSTLRMAGVVQLPTTNLFRRELPPFSFSLSGTNVPLVRRPEMIVRGDLLLGAAKTNGAPPLVAGMVRFGDSYFLSDLTALVSGKIATPREHPPYFSIKDPLLAHWRLDIHVLGDRFLKVRTTVFNGEVSANLQLSGTLKTPMVVGDVRIDSGTVQFPFGSLQVQQGFITITKANPYQPEVAITANSTQFGYDIKMQVSGTANAPIIEFSSTPPLTSEQILLLLTTGQMPQGTFTLTPQQRAQTLAAFLARDLLAKLGFIGPGESRLTVTSGQQIATTGKPTYTVEFKLTKKWALVGEYDRFGDYNVGVKWRIYSK